MFIKVESKLKEQFLTTFDVVKTLKELGLVKKEIYNKTL